MTRLPPLRAPLWASRTPIHHWRNVVAARPSVRHRHRAGWPAVARRGVSARRQVFVLATGLRNAARWHGIRGRPEASRPLLYLLTCGCVEQASNHRRHRSERGGGGARSSHDGRAPLFSCASTPTDSRWQRLTVTRPRGPGWSAATGLLVAAAANRQSSNAVTPSIWITLLTVPRPRIDTAYVASRLPNRSSLTAPRVSRAMPRPRSEELACESA